MFGDEAIRVPQAASGTGSAAGDDAAGERRDLVEKRNPIGERNVFAEHHAMHFIVRADDLAIAVHEDG